MSSPYVITASTDCQCNHTLQPVTQLLTSVRSFFHNMLAPAPQKFWKVETPHCRQRPGSQASPSTSRVSRVSRVSWFCALSLCARCAFRKRDKSEKSSTRVRSNSINSTMSILNEAWQLGGWKLRGRVVLAPMEQVTDCAFRRLCFELGASFTWTEMVRAASLLKRNNSTTSRIDTLDPSTPTAVQLMVSSPSELRRALQLLEERAQSDKLFLGSRNPWY